MWLVLGVAAIFFLVIYGQQLLLENDLKERIAVQRSANAAVEDFNSRLKSSLQYYQSDKYIEQRAREDLNLRRPDEEVLIPIREEVSPPESSNSRVDSPQPPTERNSTPVQSQEAQQPIWLAWLGLFSPPDSSR